MLEGAFKVTIPRLTADPEFQIHTLILRNVNPPLQIHRADGVPYTLCLFLNSPADLDGRRIDTGHVIIWPPDTPHRIGNRQDGWTDSGMKLGGRYPLDLLKQHNLPLRQPFGPIPEDVFSRTLSAMAHEVRTPTQPDLTILRNLFQNFVRELDREHNSTPHHSARIPARFLELRDFIEKNFAEPLDLAALARLVHLSPQYMTREFKKYFGLSAINYLIRSRMTHAQECLADRELTITEIADKTGYADIYAFSKAFRNYFGLSPTAYRRSRRSSHTARHAWPFPKAGARGKSREGGTDSRPTP